MTIPEEREALAAVLRTVDGLSNVHPRPVGQIVAPAAVIQRGTLNPEADLDASRDYEFKVTLFVQLGVIERSVENLDDLVDACVDAIQDAGYPVREVTPEGLQDIGGNQYTATDLMVTVYAS